MAQVVNRRHLTAEARVRVHVRFVVDKGHWNRFFSEYFGFPLSISFHRGSIKVENRKKPYHHPHRVAQ